MSQNNILYIDDETLNLDSFTAVFWNHYNIYTAKNTNEAYTILHQNNIKVIISDQKMPGETGLDFFNRIKPEFPDIILILLTGFADMQIVINAINSNILFRFVTKPWDKTDLKQTIDNAIKHYNINQLNNELVKNLEIKNHELIKEKEHAEESDRLKTAFLSNLSHEVRTPLNGIVGFCEMLKQSYTDQERTNFFIDLILKSSHQLINIMNNIVELSQIESKSININNQKFGINNLINEIVDYTNNYYTSNTVTFAYNNCITQNNLEIISDKNKIFETLKHIIDNAFKFTNFGTVTLTCLKNNNHLVFTIADTGIGIAPEKHELIFERFMQVEQGLTRKYGGNGLGLTLANKYIKMLNGSISIKSDLNKGSTFIVKIPVNHEQ